MFSLQFGEQVCVTYGIFWRLVTANQHVIGGLKWFMAFTCRIRIRFT